MTQPTQGPPKWPDRFLAWYCNDKVQEQVQGDAHELFYWRVEDKGLSKARRAFFWDVIRLFKWSNIKRTNHQKQQLNNIAMFKNYFKIGLRNLWKQKMPSTVNIIGLSLAVACCLVSFKWIESKLFKDRFHENAEDIYLVTPTRLIDGDPIRHGIATLDVSDKIGEQVPGVEELARYINTSGQVKVKEARFNAYYAFADPEFFDMFSFNFIRGNQEVLRDPRTVILGELDAKAYFGEADPIGKELSVEIRGEEKFFKVGAIVEEAPDNSSIRMGLIVSFELYEQDQDLLNTNTHIFIQLNPSVDMAAVTDRLGQIATEKGQLTPDTPYENMGLEPLTTMAGNSRNMDYTMGGTPPMAPMILLTVIGAFMLILATFNYVNISTMMAMKRVKEIGVRKVIGGRRGQLITQFLVENLLLCLLAVAVGCLLASAFFIPWFNGISGSNLQLDLLGHKNLWLFLIAMLIFITVASGLYPAFYISSFKPTVIFRGQGAQGGKRRLTGALLTFQMTLAIITIVAGITFVSNNSVNESKDWGYDQFNKLVFGIPPGQNYETIAAEISKMPNIESIGASIGIVGQTHNYQDIIYGDNEIRVNVFESTYDYPQLLNVKLKEGTFFDKNAQSQNKQALLVNEVFMNQLALSMDENPTVILDSANFLIVGVVADFHHAVFQEDIRPAAFRVVEDSLLTDMTVRVKQGTIVEMREELMDVVSDFNPDGTRQNVYAQDGVFDEFFSEMEGVRNIMVFTATLAVLLASMGLFGLVSLNISSRLKDFSIKKVLGANLTQLSADVYKRFIIILSVAITVGSILSVFVIGMLLDNVYGNHTGVGILPLSLAGGILLAVAAFTINTQIRSVKRMNPAENLRAE